MDYINKLFQIYIIITIYISICLFFIPTLIAIWKGSKYILIIFVLNSLWFFIFPWFIAIWLIFRDDIEDNIIENDNNIKNKYIWDIDKEFIISDNKAKNTKSEDLKKKDNFKKVYEEYKKFRKL